MLHVEAEEVVGGSPLELGECRWIAADAPVGALEVVEPDEPDDLRRGGYARKQISDVLAYAVLVGRPSRR